MNPESEGPEALKTVENMTVSRKPSGSERPNRPPRRVIIDTDPGIDDALALMLALRSPALRIEAITTVAGNVPLDHCVTNTFHILRAAGIVDPPPVARGCTVPLRREPVTALHVHGHDGLGDISAIQESDGSFRYPVPEEVTVAAHAADLIADLVGSNPGEMIVVALGPLTNIATALERAPQTMKNVRELIVMGGSLNGIGNVTPVAEFNFFADPEAAQAVVRSGFPVTLVGLDVTHQARIRRETFLEHAERSQAQGARFLSDVSKQYFDFAESHGKNECFLHDPLAIGVAIDPTFIRTESFAADVETGGSLTAGMLVADRRDILRQEDHNIEGAVEVDADRFVEFFLDGLFG